MKITVAITGASGAIYAKRLVEKLINSRQVEKIYVVMTKTAIEVVEYEIGDQIKKLIDSCDKVEVLKNDNFFVPIASGSNCADVMVILPCSMGMIGRIANGVSNDLISRAADVTIKECKKLIVVPRETPLSIVHLNNLTTLANANVVIMPANVSFYSKPQTIEQVVDTLVERVVAHIGIENNNFFWDAKFV